MKFQVDYDEVAGAYRMARTLLGCRCPLNTVCAITIPDIYPEDFDPKDPNDFENLVGMYGNDGFEMRAYCIGCHKRTKFVCGIEELPYISGIAIDCVRDFVSKNHCFHWNQLDISPRLLPWGVSRSEISSIIICYPVQCVKAFSSIGTIPLLCQFLQNH